MRPGELYRHVLGAALALVLLVGLQSRYAQHIDAGEAQVCLWMALWFACWITAAYLVLRGQPLRPRHYAWIGALLLVFLGMTCTHEIIGRVWLTAASSAGEHWEATWARHVAKGPR